MRTITVLLFLSAFSLNSVFAQSAKEKTKDFINTTTEMFVYANERLAESQNKTGEFAKASDFQEHAIKFYNEGDYRKAMLHAIQSRRHLSGSIKSNRGEINQAWEIKVKDICPPIDETKAKLAIIERNADVIVEFESELLPEVGKRESDDRAIKSFDML